MSDLTEFCTTCDPDEPCECPRQPSKPARGVRYSARYVEQMRGLGARRFPLTPVADD